MLSTLIQLSLQNLLYFALHLEYGGAFPRQLTKKEERELLDKIEAGDESARNKLIEHNLRLVAFIVRRNYSDSREQEDLISIGTIGLINAARTFDSNKQISFSTYASKCIDNQIKMHFRKTKRQSSEVYIHDSIDIDKDGNQLSLADLFRDPCCVDDQVDLIIDSEKLYNSINAVLDKRERKIICMRYGLACENAPPGKTMTQREVAATLNISRSYVSRIEKRAIEKLKDKFL
ncbi:MAG: RNA polymerase sporulation sigma factor SigK [Oscillospiraceae bacterium]|nr:RNA polymerase sporulation sigma factor SigK [Oscillospiraceae bacterium]